MRAKEPDFVENFSCGHDESVLGRNIWLPDGVLPGFNEACQAFYWVRAPPPPPVPSPFPTPGER